MKSCKLHVLSASFNMKTHIYQRQWISLNRVIARGPDFKAYFPAFAYKCLWPRESMWVHKRHGCFSSTQGYMEKVPGARQRDTRILGI